jgi:hypothetical protein
MTLADRGEMLTLDEATQVFEVLPAEWQLASLHPGLVEVDARRLPDLLTPVHWCHRDQVGIYLHSFHLGSNPGLDLADLQSAHGYGGPLSNSDAPEFLESVDAAFMNWSRERSVVAEFLRFHPLVPHATWYRGHVAENRETVHIDLGRNLMEQYQPGRRTDVKRFIQGGATVQSVAADEMLSVFPDLYRRNMDQIGAAPDYYFPVGYFDALTRNPNTDCWIVKADGAILAAAIILVSAKARVVEYHLGAKESGAERHKAMVGLLHQVAMHYQAGGFRYFYLGGGRSTAADDSLLYFKNGFSRLRGRFRVGCRVHDEAKYEMLKRKFPDRAATGRILFYKN